jgi:hypothetical protein
MSKIQSLRLIASFALLSPCFGLAACSASPETDEQSVQNGTLELPMVSHVNGHTYRLRGGYLYVNGPVYQYLDLAVDAPKVSVSLPTGDYYAYLYQSGLERDDGNGNFIPVLATQLSSYYVPFQIFNGATSTVAFEFETDGVIVRVGSGTLDVRVDVTELPAVCTPFGSECGEGAWCPPTELTGEPRGCVAAGPVSLGESCASPLDCVADASCFDFGSGPVCAALCDAGLFGAPCSQDAECVAAGREYGVCTPVAPVE